MTDLPIWKSDDRETVYLLDMDSDTSGDRYLVPLTLVPLIAVEQGAVKIEFKVLHSVDWVCYRDPEPWSPSGNAAVKPALAPLPANALRHGWAR
jgi:hypothetical protein